MFEIAIPVVIFLAGLVFVFLWVKERSHNSNLISQLNSLQLENTKVTTELKLNLEHRNLTTASIEKMKGDLQNTFVSLASKALEGNNKQFVELAKSVFESHNKDNMNSMGKKHDSIEALVRPLSEALEKYQQQSHQMIKERERGFTTIEQELKRVAETNKSLAEETSALKNALKKPHVRGRWGEVQLKNCIDLAGMSEYCDVSFQDTVTEDDAQLRPDMTVRMPGGHVVVVDAKTPLDAFMSALECNDEVEREAQIIRHGKHLKDHVKKLSSKNYAQAVSNSADFTIMFLPNESFLYAALESQKDLVEYALEQKILIATPPTLIGLLKVIRYGWNEEKLAENALRISDAGKELHKRVCSFMEAFENIGKHLDKAKNEYDSGYSRLNRGLLVQAKRLEKLGAKSKKDLPAAAHVDFTAPEEGQLVPPEIN